MNFLKACQTLVIKCGISGKGPSTVAGLQGELLRVSGWIQDAYEEICGEWLNWKFLWRQHAATTVEGDPYVNKPDGLNIWDHSTLKIEGQPLSVHEYDSIKDTWDFTEVSGKPDTAIILPDNRIQLFPTPDRVYKFSADYFCRPSIPQQDEDTFLIPEHLHNVVIGRAMIAYADFENAAEIETAGMRMFQKYMQQLEAQELPNDAYRNGVSTGSMNIQVLPE